MQKIDVLFCRYFENGQYMGKIWPFNPLWSMDKSFPEYHIYVFWSLLLLSNSMQKTRKFLRAVLQIFLKVSILGPNLTFWPPWSGVKGFFQNSKNVTFLHLWCYNFLEKIKKIWHAVPEKKMGLTNGRRTNGRTNGQGYFIGPFPDKPGGPKNKKI